MAEYLIQDTTLTEIADAVRNKTGNTNGIAVEDLASIIEGIETSIDYENTRATSISDYAFQNMNIFRSVSFPNATEIGYWSFYSNDGTSNLTTINFPLAITVGDYAFCGAKKLESVNLPSVTEIGSYAFSGHLGAGESALSSISLPSCTSIGGYAFHLCENLTNISAPKLSSLGMEAFGQCKNIKTISFPELTRISIGTFNGCSSLESIHIPKVYKISSTAFFSCVNLKHISIDGYTDSSSSGRTIDSYAFGNCTSLQSVVLPNATAVMYLSDVNAFSNTPIESGTGYIYVPDSLVDSYKTAKNWSTYATQIRPLSEYVEVDA